MRNYFISFFTLLISVSLLSPKPLLAGTVGLNDMPLFMETLGINDSDEIIREILTEDDYTPESHSYDEVTTPFDDVNIQVAIPLSLDFILDPYNISGQGTLFAPEYSIANYSNIDIELEIHDLAYSFSDNGDFLSLTEAPNQDEEAQEKMVFMFLRHLMEPQNDDFIITDQADGAVLSIRLEAANYDENGEFVSLNESSIFRFTIMGAVTNGLSAPWKSGDLKLNMVYSWSAYVPEELLPNPIDLEEDGIEIDDEETDLTENENENDTDINDDPDLNEETNDEIGDDEGEGEDNLEDVPDEIPNDSEPDGTEVIDGD
ncbi:MAG: hypothetical protein FWG91_02570 [Lachnospiraceae bacterium]|nr:hypothetical protein [Lachnospiraceae bacterium]